MVGRAMRRGSNKIARVIDCGGNWLTLGKPDEDVKWSLTKGVIRDEIKRAASKVTQCQACGYVHDKADLECPLCSHVNEKVKPLELEADVKKITGSRKGPSKKQLGAAIVATNGDLYELQALARQYGYSQKWAYKMKSVYGHVWSSRH